MALTARQVKLYEYTVNTYRKERLAGGDWGYRRKLTGLKCFLFTTSNTDSPAARVSQLKNDNQFTFDRMNCEASTDIKAEDVVEYGTDWYSVTGDPQVRPSTARRSPNKAALFLTITNKPVIIT